ncbi:MAG: protease pro-enzyme activation domain-containing protein [Acidimicrobiales bacterium]
MILVVALGISCAAAAVPAAAAAAVTAGTPASAPPPAARVGHAPTLPPGTVPAAPLPPTASLGVSVTLQPRDPAALAAYAAAVATPGSGHFRQYLDTRQFVARFGPTPHALDSVTQALVAAGLHPGAVAADHLSIPVMATASQLMRAFATGFRQYRVRDGRVAYANTVPPRVAGAAAPYVQAIVGLDDLALAAPAAQQQATDSVPPAGSLTGPHTATGEPEPCATARADAGGGTHTTDQLASAYGFSKLYGQDDFGAGQTVALYELQGFGAGDIASYQACYGTSASVATVDVDGGPLKHAGVGEADVDIEQVSSLAPGAGILVYEGPNTDAGDYDTYNTIISQDAAKVISTSWGLCEPEHGSAAAQAEDILFQEAAVQGQSVFAAAGDQGSEDCVSTGYSDDTLAVDDPASQPFVTGVGGTSWTSATTPPVETAWNDGPTCCWGAGGGGISSLWPMPSYQSNSIGTGVINAYSSATPCSAPTGSYCREVPDVSALAGPFPYLDYVRGSWGSWGGTSLAAPLWASLIALANASSSCQGASVGFANPKLYAVAAAEPQAFNDVTTGDNDLTGDNGGEFSALVGYDMATGLGTPNADKLASALCAASSPSPLVVDDPGTQVTDVGSTVSLAVSASDGTAGQTLTFHADGLPTGLSIDPTTGVITGTPTVAGTYLSSVTAEDGGGASGSTSFTWSVTEAITSNDTTSAVVGARFSFTISATGSPASIKEVGTLPKGVWLHGADARTTTLSGIPKAHDAPGAYPLVLKATYGKGKTTVVVTQSFTLTLLAS